MAHKYAAPDGHGNICPGCGDRLSTSKHRCPRCGHYIGGSVSPLIWIIIGAIIILAISFAPTP